HMDVFRTDRIRNVVLLGHGGAGKTTLAEAMAYLSGITNRLGKVSNGNTISDFDKEEIKRKSQLADGMEEGIFPQNDQEVVLSSNAQLALNVQIGDSVTVQTPAGNVDFTVSGFGSDDQEYYEGQTYLIAVYMTENAFASLMNE